MKVGDTFLNYAEYKAQLKAYEEKISINYSVSDSTTIKRAKVKQRKKTFKDELQYSYIKLTCEHGGSYKCKGTGMRPNQKSAKIECPSVIIVGCNNDGDKLVVRTMNTDHNHEAFKNTRKQRKLTEEDSRSVDSFIRRPVKFRKPDADLAKFGKVLTPYNDLVPARGNLETWQNVPCKQSGASVVTRKKKILSSAEKFKDSAPIALELQNVLSQCGQKAYNERIAQLKILLSLWKAGKETGIMEIVNDDVFALGEGDGNALGQDDGNALGQDDGIALGYGISKNRSFPIRIKRIRRSKGTDSTVLGLPRQHKSNKIRSFAKKTISEKKSIMLKWLFGDGDHETLPDIIASQFFDKNVKSCLHLLSDVLDIDSLTSKIKDSPKVWFCGNCTNRIDETRAVICESCLVWFHYSCAGITKAPTFSEWFCKFCKNAVK